MIGGNILEAVDAKSLLHPQSLTIQGLTVLSTKIEVDITKEAMRIVFKVNTIIEMITRELITERKPQLTVMTTDLIHTNIPAATEITLTDMNLKGIQAITVGIIGPGRLLLADIETNKFVPNFIFPYPLQCKTAKIRLRLTDLPPITQRCLEAQFHQEAI